MTGPCPRPECGGTTHTDGWGNPTRCPHEPVGPDQPPQATPLEEAQATIESLRYQIRRAREALGTDEPAVCGPACGHEAAIAELAQAIRLTREYVGEELLPPIEGWSWYDALRRHAPHELPTSEGAP